MTTAFLLTHIPNPRMNKRISVAEQCGKAKVICTRRHSQDIWEPRKSNNVEYTIMDIDLPSTRYIFNRLLKSMKYRRNSIRYLKRIKPDVIYTESLDSLIIACMYYNKHKCDIIFEVADLREVYIESPKSIKDRLIKKMLNSLEKYCFSRISKLVITSEKYYDMHYKNRITRDKVLCIPNVPDLEPFSDYKHKMKGTFTVGFIGSIRYLEQMKMLIDIAKEHSFDVLFAGAGGTKSEYDDIFAYCKGKEHIHFTGKYDYDTEIARIYSSVDCVYAVYDADNINVSIALPNKLYEAVYCELPIIVSKGTYLAELVNEWGVGIAVSHTDSQELVEALLRLQKDSDYYEKIRIACRAKKNEMDASLYQHMLMEVIKRK